LELESDSIANQLVLACYQQGLHLIGPLAGNVLRISPPLIISPTEAEAGIGRMRRALQQI
ncbi:MAG: aspartate aminotransferase family protein, partial [Candidatus Poribacteria bacterium]|nr:aspartate aminotransferase family protein [Candidatus Poribacteria bacterium]